MDVVDSIIGCFAADDILILESCRTYADPVLPNWPAAIEFRFPTFAVKVEVRAGDDTLECVRLTGADVQTTLQPLESEFWTRFEGQALLHVCVVCNGLPGADRIQLTFQERPTEGRSSLIDITAMASHLCCLELAVAREFPAPGTPADGPIGA